MVQAFHAGDRQFAATMHSCLRAYSEAALRDARRGLVTPPRYANLSGLSGLSSFDPAWLQLQQLPVGSEFFVVGGGCARAPLPVFFPDVRGMRVEKLVEIDPAEVWEFELQDSDIVEFISLPPDRRGYHSLVQDSFLESEDADQFGWSAPLLSSVRLLHVRDAGEWCVRGLYVERRCYTVTVSFGG